MRSVAARLRSRPAASIVPIAVITLIGAALRLPEIDQSLYGDEMWSYEAATSSGLDGVIDFVRSNEEITPPLYPILAWLSAKLGDPAVLVRLPTMLAGIATIPLIYGIARRTLGVRVALVAGLLAALSPFLSFYAVEARAYAVAIALVATSTLCMLIALDRKSGRWWTAYGLASCAAMYSHYTSAYVLAAQLAWLLWFHRESWKPALAANSIAALAFLPWVPGLLEDLDSPTVGIISVLAPFDSASFLRFTGSWALGHPSNGLLTFWGTALEVVLVAGLALGAVGLVLRRRAGARGDSPRRTDSLALIVLLALATPAAIAVVSLAGDDMYIPRNLGASWPAWSIALAALVTAGPRPVWIGSTTLIVVAFTCGAIRTGDDDWQRPDVAGAARFIDELAGPGDLVLDAVGGTRDPGSPPARTLEIQLEQPHRIVDAIGIPDVERGVEEAAGHKLVLVGLMPFVEPLRQAPGLAGVELASERTFPGLVVTSVQVFDVPERPGPRGPPSGGPGA